MGNREVSLVASSLSRSAALGTDERRADASRSRDERRERCATITLLVSLATWMGCSQPVRPPTGGDRPTADSSVDSAFLDDRDAGVPDAPDAMEPTDDSGIGASVDGSTTDEPESPLLVPEDDVWTFVPVEGMRCGDGSATGVGVNLRRTSDELLIYFQGGGACWNEATCGLGIASRTRSGYGPSELADDAFSEWLIFRREDSENPFERMSYIVVPYCTGDVHAGTRTDTGPGRSVLHHGARNVDALIPSLVHAFPGLRRVVLAGTSAGGFGAQLNYEKFANAFPDLDVDLIADGAQLVNPAGGLVTDWVNTWGIEIPSDCEGCSEDFPRYLEYLFDRYPRAGFGLLASMRDATLTPFFNYGVNAQAYRNATSDVLDLYDRSAGGAYLVRSGVRHGYLEKVANLDRRENAASFAWLRRVLEGERPRQRP